jgi:hypothetical protein
MDDHILIIVKITNNKTLMNKINNSKQKNNINNNRLVFKILKCKNFDKIINSLCFNLFM